MKKLKQTNSWNFCAINCTKKCAQIKNWNYRKHADVLQICIIYYINVYNNMHNILIIYYNYDIGHIDH